MSRESYDKKNQHYIELMESHLSNMPHYIRSYIYEVEGRILPRTRYGYVCDLESFFWYLIDHNPNLQDLSDITIEYLNQLTVDDFNTS